MKLSFEVESFILLGASTLDSLKSTKSGSLLPCFSRILLPGDKVTIDSDNLSIVLSSLPQPDFEGILIEH